MSYKTYTTEAVVCGSFVQNTADKSYLLFTRDGGMLYASARSVREERSRQRYALQDFSQLRVTLLKGKHGWKIGSAEALGNAFLSAPSRECRALVSFVVGALRRYVHGEVALPQVFDDLLFILRLREIPPQPLRLLFEARLLFVLGYIAPEEDIRRVLDASSLSEAMAAYMPEMEGPLAAAIEQAAAVSHL
jgi:recombinational DNA repair protein (RecF pathway)